MFDAKLAIGFAAAQNEKPSLLPFCCYALIEMRPSNSTNPAIFWLFTSDGCDLIAC
jgi:hypothetical protein